MSRILRKCINLILRGVRMRKNRCNQHNKPIESPVQAWLYTKKIQWLRAKTRGTRGRRNGGARSERRSKKDG